APGVRLSSTIRAFSSTLHRRRRSGPSRTSATAKLCPSIGKLLGNRSTTGLHNTDPLSRKPQYRSTCDPGSAYGIGGCESNRASRYLPLPQLKTTGAQTQFDNLAGQRFVFNHTHLAFGLGYAFTREAIDDNLYRSQFNPANLGLLKAF